MHGLGMRPTMALPTDSPRGRFVYVPPKPAPVHVAPKVPVKVATPARKPVPVHTVPIAPKKPAPKKPVVCSEIACGNTVGHGPAPCFTPICGPTKVTVKPPAKPAAPKVTPAPPKPLPPGACPSGKYPVNGVCEATGTSCPSGYVDASGNCVPLSAPAASAGTCPTGYQIDSAGNCTPAGAEHNPYSLYLPAGDVAPGGTATPATAAAVSACATGYFADNSGNCFPNTLQGWLQASTLITGVPNYEVAGGAVAVAIVGFLLMSGKSKPAARKR